MSEIRRVAPTEATIMEPYLVGDGLEYRETTVKKWSWQCLGCGLLWSIKWHAESCERRDHAPRWEQMYCRGTENGQPINPRYYPRISLGRAPLPSPAALARAGLPPATEPSLPKPAGVPLGIRLTEDGQWELTSPTGRSICLHPRSVLRHPLAVRCEAALLDCLPVRVTKEEMAYLLHCSTEGIQA